MENTVRLLTNEERAQLPTVLARRSKFRKLITLSIRNYDKTFSNCIMIQGKPGSGKTYMTEELLNQLKEELQINTYKRVPGHVTPKSLYHVMKDVAKPVESRPSVLLLDDVDCLGEEGCLELMKAAFDTKSNAPTNRKVFYMTEDGGTGFRFNGFGIIICNNDFFNHKMSVHQQALLDRVQMMSIDLEPGDMNIYNAYLIEKMLNDNNEHFSQEEINTIVDLYNNDVRKWIKTDAFRRAKVNFSIRLIKKFVDASRLFGEDWKDFNMTYKQLNAAAEMSEVEASLKTTVVTSTAKKAEEPAKNKDGLYIKKDGTVYSQAMQYTLKKRYAA